MTAPLPTPRTVEEAALIDLWRMTRPHADWEVRAVAFGRAVLDARMPSVEEVAEVLVDQVAAREAVQRLIDRAVEVAADDTPLLVAVQDARAAVVALWGAL